MGGGSPAVTRFFSVPSLAALAVAVTTLIIAGPADARNGYDFAKAFGAFIG
jgi:hypothetical protein